MPERDFANDYDEWLRLTGGDNAYGGTIPTQTPVGGGQAEAPYDPWAAAGQQPPPSTPPRPGYFWAQLPDGTWVETQSGAYPGQAPTTPAATPAYDYGPPVGGGVGGGAAYFGNIQPPDRTSLGALNYPTLNLPRFQAPPAFSYENFTLPTLEEAQNEPGFDYALQQGVKAYENSKAYTGTYRGGATLKGINDYARNMANQNYGQVFQRKADTYDRNRNNAAQNYMTNYGVTRDVFDRNYSAVKDEFAPLARARELEFARDFDLFTYEGDDAYRRQKMLIDAQNY